MSASAKRVKLTDPPAAALDAGELGAPEGEAAGPDALGAEEADGLAPPQASSTSSKTAPRASDFRRIPAPLRQRAGPVVAPPRWTQPAGDRSVTRGDGTSALAAGSTQSLRRGDPPARRGENREPCHARRTCSGSGR